MHATAPSLAKQAPDYPRKERYVKIAALVIAAAAVVITILVKPAAILFWEFTKEDIVRLFTELMIIALIIERAIEVFLTPWRSGEADRLETEEKHAQKRAEATKHPGESVTVTEATIARSDFKHGTRQLAFLVGLAMGVIISALGVRALTFLVEPQAFANLAELQRTLFTILDVLLTGAMLAGGADGLHKVVSVFTNYMDTTADKAKS